MIPDKEVQKDPKAAKYVKNKNKNIQRKEK